MPEGRARAATDANLFRQLHAGPDLLTLTNAWDAVSARVMADLGARAIATSSAAVAWSHGYPDGNRLPVALLLTTLTDIARGVALPITADIESGYSDEPRAVGDLIGAVIDAGVVGVNLEDRAEPADLLCRKIDEARRAADRAGVRLFVNARADVFLKTHLTGEAAIAEALSRAARYREAGADGFFAPGVIDQAAIQTIAREVALPLNVMARPGLPPAATLQRIGVRRLSSATWFARVSLTAMREAAVAFLATGNSDSLAGASGAPFIDYNAWFAR